MRVAILADIHGNADALEAAIGECTARGAEEYWVLGDLIGYGPEPNRTVDLLKDLPARIILGNYDRKIIDYVRGNGNTIWPKTVLKRLLFEWTAREMKSKQVDWLASMPSELMFELEGRKVHLAHGIPGNDEGTLVPGAPKEQFSQVLSASGPNVDLICLGHTHRTLNQSSDGVRFLNPGTLGRSEDGDPSASCILLNITPKVLRASVLRVNYPSEGTASKVRKHRLPLAIELLYRNGQRLKDVLNGPVPPMEDPERDSRVKTARNYVKKCHFNTNHEGQVARTAGVLFDAMWNHHGLGYEEKTLMVCAAYLHDIGWMSGRKKHHKNSRDMILADDRIPLNDHERLMVALIARYHRGAIPDVKEHKHYKALGLIDRWKVNMLAGILRVADGIDHSHLSEVESIHCQSNRTHILIGVAGKAGRGLLANALAAQEKSDLLAWALRKKVQIAMNTEHTKQIREKDHRTD